MRQVFILVTQIGGANIEMILSAKKIIDELKKKDKNKM